MMRLSNKQIQNFKNTGFLIVRKLYYGEELNEITQWVIAKIIFSK